MVNLTVSNNSFISHAGNSPNPGSIAYVSSAIAFRGSREAAHPSIAHPYAGMAVNVAALNNYFQIPHIKQAVTVWSSVDTVSIANNSMNGVGVSGDIPDDRGAYAILVYNDSYQYNADGTVSLTGGSAPNNVVINANNMVGVHSCGVYAASVNRIYVQDNYIADQSDFVNVTLPKGAIAMNSPQAAVVTGNVIVNAAIGLGLYGLTTGGSILSTANNSITVRAGGTGIWVQSYADDLIQISSTSIDASAAGAKAYWAPVAGGTIQFQ